MKSFGSRSTRQSMVIRLLPAMSAGKTRHKQSRILMIAVPSSLYLCPDTIVRAALSTAIILRHCLFSLRGDQGSLGGSTQESIKCLSCSIEWTRTNYIFGCGMMWHLDRGSWKPSCRAELCRRRCSSLCNSSSDMNATCKSVML